MHKPLSEKWIVFKSNLDSTSKYLNKLKTYIFIKLNK